MVVLEVMENHLFLLLLPVLALNNGPHNKYSMEKWHDNYISFLPVHRLY